MQFQFQNVLNITVFLEAQDRVAVLLQEQHIAKERVKTLQFSSCAL